MPEMKPVKNDDLYNFGRLQPQAQDLEKAVLGAILLDKDVMPIVAEVLTPESFYNEHHKIIYEACLWLFEKSRPIDMLTVTERLKNAGQLDSIGGGYAIVTLTNTVGSSANIEYHARIVQQKHIERRLIEVGNEMVKAAYGQEIDTFEQVENAEKSLYAVTHKSYSKQEKSVGHILPAVISEIEAAKNRDDGLTGEPSGITSIDRITGGWQRSDLIIIAARPGMGKTSLAIAIAKNLSMQFDKAVAVFSLEMSERQIVSRLLSDEARVNSRNLRSAKLHDFEWHNVHRAMEALGDMKFFIDDTPGLSITEMRAKGRRLKKKHDIKLVVVDYIQLMRAGDTKGNREQEISTISRGLKEMAKELDIPVIALSQLSRAVETRGGSKRPMLSDLRESGAIEQDADLVAFIYRPEYYNIMEDENGVSTKGLAEFIIAKHRNGALDTVPLCFEAEFTTFTDQKAEGYFPKSEPEIFQLQKVLTTPSKINDDEDIPF